MMKSTEEVSLGQKRKVFSITATAPEQRKVVEESVFSAVQTQAFSIDNAAPAKTFGLTEYDSLLGEDIIQYRQLKKVETSLMVGQGKSTNTTNHSSNNSSSSNNEQQVPPCKQALLEIQKAGIEMEFLTEVMTSIRDHKYIQSVNVQTELQQVDIDHGPILPVAQRLHHVASLYQHAHTTITTASDKAKALVESRRKSLVSLTVVKKHWNLSVVHAANLSAVWNRRFSLATDLAAINCAMIPQSQLHNNSYLVPLNINQDDGVQIVEQDKLHHKFAQHRTLRASFIAADSREVLATKTIWDMLTQYDLHDTSFNTDKTLSREQRQGERINMHCYQRRHESFATELFRELKDECNHHCAKLAVESLEKAQHAKSVDESDWIAMSILARNHLVVISLSEHRLEVELNAKVNVQFELVPLKVKESTASPPQLTTGFKSLTSILELIMLELRVKLLEKLQGEVHPRKVSAMEAVLSKAWRGKKYQLHRQVISPSNITFLQDIVLKVYACQCAAMKVKAVLERCQEKIRQLMPSLSTAVLETTDASAIEIDATIGSCIDTFHFQFIVDKDYTMTMSYAPTSLLLLRAERKSDGAASKDLKQWRQSTELYADDYIASLVDLEYAVLTKAIAYSIRLKLEYAARQIGFYCAAGYDNLSFELIEDKHFPDSKDDHLHLSCRIAAGQLKDCQDHKVELFLVFQGKQQIHLSKIRELTKFSKTRRSKQMQEGDREYSAQEIDFQSLHAVNKVLGAVSTASADAKLRIIVPLSMLA